MTPRGSISSLLETDTGASILIAITSPVAISVESPVAAIARSAAVISMVRSIPVISIHTTALVASITGDIIESPVKAEAIFPPDKAPAVTVPTIHLVLGIEYKRIPGMAVQSDTAAPHADPASPFPFEYLKSPGVATSTQAPTRYFAAGKNHRATPTVVIGKCRGKRNAQQHQRCHQAQYSEPPVEKQCGSGLRRSHDRFLLSLFL